MTKARGTVTAVMIGVIEAREEVTIGELDQEWVTEIVEVPEIVDLLSLCSRSAWASGVRVWQAHTEQGSGVRTLSQFLDPEH